MPDLVRRQVYLDGAGLALETAPDSARLTAKVLALPVRFDVSGMTWEKIVEKSKEIPDARPIDFHLADYLPSYVSKLLSDLETALSEGRSVFLWGDKGLRLAGYPLFDGPRWTDTDRWYPTAADALGRVNGLRMEEIP